MSSSAELVQTFFHDLKRYNATNFRTIEKADLSVEDATVHKSCSSVVTRYFIFRERHPEIPESDMKMLYFKLRIDMIARYFSEYPAASLEDLRPFQTELRRYVKDTKDGEEHASTSTLTV